MTHVFAEIGCYAPSLANGRITYDQDPLGDGYPIETVINATCNDGYYLNLLNTEIEYFSSNCTLDTTVGQG